LIRLSHQCYGPLGWLTEFAVSGVVAILVRALTEGDSDLCDHGAPIYCILSLVAKSAYER